jgi:hypothetical protein
MCGNGVGIVLCDRGKTGAMKIPFLPSMLVDTLMSLAASGDSNLDYDY